MQDEREVIGCLNADMDVTYHSTNFYREGLYNNNKSTRPHTRATIEDKILCNQKTI